MGDDGGFCALCCTKFDPEKMSMCDKCVLQYWGRLKRSARAVQLFGRLAVLETHTLRY